MIIPILSDILNILTLPSEARIKIAGQILNKNIINPYILFLSINFSVSAAIL
jgi:hypothetical protein